MLNLILNTIDSKIFIDITNTIGILICVIVLTNSRVKKKYLSLDKKIYISMIISIISILIVDTIFWTIDKVEGLDTLNRIVNCIYFAMNPLVSILWVLYVDLKIFNNEKALKKRMIIYLIPFIFNFILSFSNLFTDIIFTIQAHNVYQRLGLGLYLSISSSYIYVLYTFILTLIYRKRVSKRTFTGLIFFCLPPFICSIVQVIFYGVSLIWIGEALAILIVFTHIQNDNASTDSLTGVFNRHYLEEYLINKLKNLNPKEFFFGIMIDIDDFKSINDNYGHLVGDRAIIEMSNLLQNSVGNNEIVTRYAGDEFIILSQASSNSRVFEIINELEQKTKQFNDNSHEQFILSYSLGYYIARYNDSLELFLKNVDNNMYLNKKLKKQKNKQNLF